MYVPVDFKCEDCESVFEISKGSMLAPTPENVECPECGSTNTYRKFSIGATDVAEGRFGNAKNGYQNGVMYHPSSLTGKVKGTRVK